MYRLLPGLALLLVLAACGSGTTKQSAEPPSPSASASATADPVSYFRQEDSKAINAAASPAQAAIRNATSKVKTCNAAKTFPAWRKCWHGLLDPVTTGLAKTAATMRRLSHHDLPEKCVRFLRKVDDQYLANRKTVLRLLGAIDGDDHDAQQQAVDAVYRTMLKTQKTYNVTFPRMTQACYSPADLASINASPSASAP